MAHRAATLEKYQVLIEDLFRRRDEVSAAELEEVARNATVSEEAEPFLVNLPDPAYREETLVTLVNKRIRAAGKEEELGLLELRYPRVLRTGSETPVDPEDLAMAEGKDPTPEIVEKYRQRIREHGMRGAIDRCTP